MKLYEICIHFVNHQVKNQVFILLLLNNNNNNSKFIGQIATYEINKILQIA